MFKVIEFSSDGAFLSLNRGFLEVKFNGEQKRVPISDVKNIIFTGNSQTLTTNLIKKLLKEDIVMLFCDEKYLPLGMLLPHFSSGQLNKRVHLQFESSVAFKKNSWKIIVSKKIEFQSEVLRHFFGDDFGLVKMTKKINSGDTNNIEAQAAKLYWSKLFLDFRRGNKKNEINYFLNYGYSILRSSVARSVVAYGLHPALGVFHKNLENNFCLVDDLMEIFRPFVDIKVKEYLLQKKENAVIDVEFKKYVVSFFHSDHISFKNNISPAYLCIDHLVASYVSSLELKYPTLHFPSSVLNISNENAFKV